MTVIATLLLTMPTALANPWTGEPDADGDGIHSAFDACPYEAEDMDGYQDDDGCPEATRVLFVFTDSDGTALQPTASIEGFGPLPNRRLLPVGLDTGSYTVEARLEGFEPLNASIAVPGGHTHRVALVLRPLGDVALLD